MEKCKRCIWADSCTDCNAENCECCSMFDDGDWDKDYVEELKCRGAEYNHCVKEINGEE